MLFDAGKRPDTAALIDLVSSIDGIGVAHAPLATAESANQAGDWLEVVIDGLTFDISGLASSVPPEISNFTGSAEVLELVKGNEFEAVAIAPGPHLAGGAYLLPILRGLLSLGALLGENLDGLIAYAWPPSSGFVSPDLFRSNAEAWASGGTFPATILMRLTGAPDGGLETKGLSVFTGQELRLEPDIADDPDTAHRLGLRLVNQLVLRGRIDAVEEVTGPDGNPLRLEPSKNGKFVRVWRG